MTEGLMDWVSDVFNLLFWCGALGAFGVEVISIFQAYRRGRPPKKIKLVGFWISWIVVCVVARFLARFVVKLNPYMVATGVGAAIATILERLARQEKA